MTKEDKEKGDISRGNLQQHGIFFHPADSDAESNSANPDPFVLPEHVDSIREGLLEMDNVIADCWREHLRQEAIGYAEADMGPTWSSEPSPAAFVQEEQHLIDKGAHSQEWIVADENLQRCLEIAKRARDLLKHPEIEWNLFWRRHVFRLFSDEADRQSGFNPSLDEWSLYGEFTWNSFHEWSEARGQEGTLDRTMPKPDLTYAFPVQGQQLRILKGFARDDLLQTFSLQVLGSLVEQGVTCTPTTALRQWVKAPEKTEMSATDSSCFPWSVVEMKRNPTKDKASIERCYCQAANGAAAALDMHAQLYQRSGHELISRQPPVMAFTCNGPIVKVWLAYQDDSKLSQKPRKVSLCPTEQIIADDWKRMVCIWTTSVQLTWGVASLRAVLLNMHTWASRLLKPKLQGCVYTIYASLRKMPESSSESSSLHTTLSASSISQNDDPNTQALPEEYASPASRTLDSGPGLLQTPPRRQLTLPEPPQERIPTDLSSIELPISKDGTKLKITRLPDSRFDASCRKNIFYFGSASNKGSSYERSSFIGSSTVSCTNIKAKALPVRPTSPVLCVIPSPRTPQTQRRVVKNSNLSIVASLPSQRIPKSPTIGNKPKQMKRTEYNYTRNKSSSQGKAIYSSRLNDERESLRTFTFNFDDSRTWRTLVGSSSTTHTARLVELTNTGTIDHTPSSDQSKTIAITADPELHNKLHGSHTLTQDVIKESKGVQYRTGTNSNDTGFKIPGPFRRANAGSSSSFSFADMASEISVIAGEHSERPQAINESLQRSSDADQQRGTSRELTVENDASQNHNTGKVRNSGPYSDDDITPRPVAKSASSRHNYFEILSTTGPSDAEESDASTSTHDDFINNSYTTGSANNGTDFELSNHRRDSIGSETCTSDGARDNTDSEEYLSKDSQPLNRRSFQGSDNNYLASYISSESSITDHYEISDDDSDPTYEPDSSDDSASGDDEYSDSPTDSESSSDDEHYSGLDDEGHLSGDSQASWTEPRIGLLAEKPFYLGWPGELEVEPEPDNFKERKEREKALKTVADSIPVTFDSSITASLEQFKNNDLDTSVATKLTPVTDRIAAVEKSVTTSLEYQKSVTEKSEKTLTDLTTYVDTQIKQCSFNLESAIIPQALSPLVQKIHDISNMVTSFDTTIQTICRAQKENVVALELRNTRLERSICDLKQSHEKELSQLRNTITTLANDMAASTRSMNKLQGSQKEDNKAIQIAIDGLRAEVHDERQRRTNTDTKLQSIKQGLQTAGDTQLAVDAKLKTVLAQTVATRLDCENIKRSFNQQLQDHAAATKTEISNADRTLNAKMDQQKREITQNFERCDRIERMGTNLSQTFAKQDLAVNDINNRLVSLKDTVVALGSTMRNVNNHVDKIIPMSSDIEEMKDQHRDHLMNCKAQIEEGLNTLADDLKRSEASRSALQRKTDRLQKRHCALKIEIENIKAVLRNRDGRRDDSRMIQPEWLA
ncbi:hypothetical protein OPT61_g3241 [Boeremia exigua]|uniref:Uncharacterized protein n=1 Tax=Boeremia exigua TaxID=749465 RepID=A0ACC2IIV6_9PLEO|nr:hypothetical protein OPT61_g3241 [Boeremia exigua]